MIIPADTDELENLEQNSKGIKMDPVPVNDTN